MKKSLIGIIIIFILLFLGIIILLETKDNSIDKRLQDIKEKIESKDKPHEKEDTKANYSKEDSEEIQEEKINGEKDSIKKDNFPEDINKKPCGYYYSEYKICGGICLKGDCVQEKRSCYCKE